MHLKVKPWKIKFWGDSFGGIYPHYPGTDSRDIKHWELHIPVHCHNSSQGISLDVFVYLSSTSRAQNRILWPLMYHNQSVTFWQLFESLGSSFRNLVLEKKSWLQKFWSWKKVLGKTSTKKNVFFRALPDSPNRPQPPPWPQFGQLGPFFRTSFKVPLMA